MLSSKVLTGQNTRFFNSAVLFHLDERFVEIELEHHKNETKTARAVSRLDSFMPRIEFLI